MPGIEFIAELPHELFIKWLYLQNKSTADVVQTLSDSGLAEPTSHYLARIAEKPIEFTCTTEDMEEVIRLLSHPERDVLDVLCIVYRDTKILGPKLLEEAEAYGIIVEKSDHLILYQQMFWHPTAVNNRIAWKKFLKTLPDDDVDASRPMGYKHMLRLARMGDMDLLMWKLQRPRETLTKERILTETLQLAHMRLRESMYMENNESTSKIAANYGTLIVNCSRQLNELENQVQYDDVLKTLKEGMIQVALPEEGHKTLEEVLADEQGKEREKERETIGCLPDQTETNPGS